MKYGRFLVCAASGLLCSACSERVVSTTQWGDDSPASSITRLEGVLEGPYLLFHPGGKQHVESHYAGGLRHGLYSEWYPNGQRVARGAYERGLRVGEWEEWTEEALPKTKGSYRAGDKDGPWILYDEAGRAQFEDTWVLGTRVARKPL